VVLVIPTPAYLWIVQYTDFLGLLADLLCWSCLWSQENCVERDRCKKMRGITVQDQRWISAVLFASLAHSALVQALS
jgi:hypothetical protein